jgi:hypothetical protein
LAGDPSHTANPLWELSSFSEAAKAAALLVEVMGDRSNGYGLIPQRYSFRGIAAFPQGALP